MKRMILPGDEACVGLHIANSEVGMRCVIRCQCGRLLTACWSQGKTKRCPYYRCVGCRGVNLAKAEVEQAFTGLLNQLQPREERVKKLRARMLRRWHLLAREIGEQATKIDRQIVSLKRLQQAEVLKSAQGVVPDELAKEQIEELQQKILDHEATRPQGNPATVQAEKVTDFFFRFLSRPGTAWQKSDLSEKKRLQRFYWPTGLTYLGDGLFRTHPDDPFTGLQSGLRRDLSHEAGKQNRTPNSVARKQRKRQDRENGELGELCLKVYEEFGPF